MLCTRTLSSGYEEIIDGFAFLTRWLHVSVSKNGLLIFLFGLDPYVLPFAISISWTGQVPNNLRCQDGV